MAYAVTAVTPKGLQWLSAARPTPLCVLLPPNMEEELCRQQRREAAEAQRAADRAAAQQRKDEEGLEKARLLVALRGARKARADELGQVRAYVLKMSLATSQRRWRMGIVIVLTLLQVCVCE